MPNSPHCDYKNLMRHMEIRDYPIRMEKSLHNFDHSVFDHSVNQTGGRVAKVPPSFVFRMSPLMLDLILDHMLISIV